MKEDVQAITIDLENMNEIAQYSDEIENISAEASAIMIEVVSISNELESLATTLSQKLNEFDT